MGVEVSNKANKGCNGVSEIRHQKLRNPRTFFDTKPIRKNFSKTQPLSSQLKLSSQPIRNL